MEADAELESKSNQCRVTEVTEETLFAAALEKATPADRAAFLDEACVGDASMRRRVDALLWSHENAEFLNRPAIELGGIALRRQRPDDGLLHLDGHPRVEPP